MNEPIARLQSQLLTSFVHAPAIAGVTMREIPGLLSFCHEYSGNLNIRQAIFLSCLFFFFFTVCLNLDPKCTDPEEGRNLLVTSPNLGPLTCSQ